MTLWLTIAAVAALSFACKALGPAVLGGRTPPPRAQAAIALTAPALLAGFIVVSVLGPRWTSWDPTMIAGLAVVPLLLRHRAPLPVALAAAVAVTAALRIWVWKRAEPSTRPAADNINDWTRPRSRVQTLRPRPSGPGPLQERHTCPSSR
ncbi:AzlD domain-containing protein [Streptomyces griseus]|uniref:AzlD domain-containing protein n=1 Tax=Streptomyces griseus TaxID=1911 RepID=UPI0036AD11DC